MSFSHVMLGVLIVIAISILVNPSILIGIMPTLTFLINAYLIILFLSLGLSTITIFFSFLNGFFGVGQHN